MGSMKLVVTLSALFLVAGVACSKAATPEPVSAPTATEAPATAAAPTVAPTEADTGATVTGTVTEMTVTAEPATAPAGEITFDVTNTGAAEHEFVVMKTDIGPADLPTGSDSRVDEEGNGVANVGEIGSILPGNTESVTLDLKPGKYVIMCNLPGHYVAGMHTGLTVT